MTKKVDGKFWLYKNPAQLEISEQCGNLKMVMEKIIDCIYLVGP